MNAIITMSALFRGYLIIPGKSVKMQLKVIVINKLIYIIYRCLHFTYTVKKCKEVRCSMKEDCGEGMYFEEGPSFFDDCCPVNGHCVCNVSLCTGPPKSCPVGTKLVMTEAADQKSGKCCNKYECQPSKNNFLN